MAQHLRLLSWNVTNLVPWFAHGDAFAAHLATLGSADIVCLQEICVRPQDGDNILAARALLPGYTCAVSLANDARNVRFRGGRAYGVATYVRDSLETIDSVPAWDREGRIVVTAIPALHLAVINIYAVNGTDKPYLHPDTGAAMGDRHEHKRRFQDRVIALATELRSVSDVIIAGDWNVSQTALDVTPRLRTSAPHATARAQLATHLQQGGWTDAFRALHPDERKYSWFGRTRTGALDAARVDFIVVDTEMMTRVTSAEILDARAARPKTDHAPLALELEPRRH